MATKRKNPETLVARLIRMEGQPLGSKEYRIRYTPAPDSGGPMYLMGSPYLWTTYIERAYVFRSREDANALIADFQKLFNASAEVVETERTEA